MYTQVSLGSVAYTHNYTTRQLHISCNFQYFSNLFVSEGLSAGLIQSYIVTFLWQSLVLQQVSDFKFSLILESVGLIGFIASVIVLLSTQDFLLGVLAALFCQSRKVDLSLCVKSCFGDLLCLLVKTTFLWPSTFLAFEICWLTLSWKLSFWSFGLYCQGFHWCFWLLRASLKHIFFVEFSSILCCQLAKVFVAYSSIINFQSC